MKIENLDVLIEDTRWETANLEALTHQATAAVFTHFGMPLSGYEISVMGCDDTRIAGLNQEFREKSAPTNVLSWPAQDRSTAGKRPETPAYDPNGMPTELGDIAISYDTCEREALAAGKPMDHHVTHLIVHAILHLLGYDHIIDKDAAIMEATEVEILGKLGLSNPYLDHDVK